MVPEQPLKRSLKGELRKCDVTTVGAGTPDWLTWTAQETIIPSTHPLLGCGMSESGVLYKYNTAGMIQSI